MQAFEWDEEKAQSNFLKHGISFETAKSVFADPTCALVDTSRAADEERRMKAIGIVRGRFLTVVYTPRAGVIRIISARRSNPPEVRSYVDR